MKKSFFTTALAAVCLSLLVTLSGCFKDSCRNTYTIYTPVYRKLSEVRAEMKSVAPRPLSNTGKLYVYGNYIFLNEVRKGIHVIDNTNPSQPKNVGFINVPGNVDLAVKGNYLYADCYSDVIVFDISNPVNVTVKRFMDNVLKEQGYFWGNKTNPDSVSIVVDYARRDTVVDCETYQIWTSCRSCKQADANGGFFLTSSPLSSAPGTQGSGGSMARFSIVNDYMYGVTTSRLYSFSLADPSQPVQVNAKSMGWGIETIYPFQNKLFLGSNTGVFICDISNPANPVAQSRFTHANVCDPVITDGHHAYVTLRSGNACNGFTNQLDVLDVSDMSNPTMVKSYPMTNPHGLAKDGNLLFICDGKSGLKVYSAANANSLQLLQVFPDMKTFDVIALGGKAIVVAEDGLYQYDYSNVNNIRLLSKISISK